MPDILTDDEFPELGQAKNAPIAGNGADTIEFAQGNGACKVNFTVFTAPGCRLAKLFKLAADGGIKTESRPEFSTGGYYVANAVAANPRETLKAFGEVIDQLKFDCAIGLGVPLNGAGSGLITTKKRKLAGKDPDAITRTLEHFGWPNTGLLLLDGDDIDGLFDILCGIYPPFAEVAFLSRPSASAGVGNPKTGKALKRGEHGYCVLDEPARSKEVLKALTRLAWCKGSGEARGFLKLSSAGSILPPYGPVDTTVGSPERVSYEGANVISKGVKTLPRNSVGHGGHGMLIVKDLIAYADEHAPEDQFKALVEAEKSKPEFIAQRAAIRGEHREKHIKTAVKRGIPRKKVEKAYDKAIAAGERTIGERTFLPLTDEYVLFFPDGRSFTVADIKANPKKFHGKECADPVEGLDYKSSNPGIIYTDGPEIVIYSRAHGDAFAYVAPMRFDHLEFAELLDRISAPGWRPGGQKKQEKDDADRPETFDDLPLDLKKMIASAPYPGEDPNKSLGSAAFRLFGRGWTSKAVEELFAAHPCGIGAALKERGDPSVVMQGLWSRFIESDEAERNAVITKINAHHALVLAGDKAAIMKFEGITKFRLLQVDSFKLWFGTEWVQVGDKAMTAGKYWLSHPKRRKFEGIEFEPAGGRKGYYNLWRGFAVQARQGDCSKFLAHLVNNVAQGDHVTFRWILSWWAQIFQQPAIKMETALVLRGGFGTGKTKVGKVFGSLMGQHYLIVSNPRYITGQFNSHMKALLVLHADEAFWAGDKKSEGTLKDLVSGDTHMLEHKGIDPIEIKNFIRLFVSGNPDWMIPAGFKDRRWAVFDIGEDKMQDNAYFAAIDKEMDEGGREALLYHLLYEIDLSKVNLRVVPKTAALLKQQIESMDAEQSWWMDTLSNGQLPAPSGCNEKLCLREGLHERYVYHAKQQGSAFRSSQTKLGMFLQKQLGEKLKDVRPQLGTGLRPRCYEMPSLKECRELFAAKIGRPIDWGEDWETDEWQYEAWNLGSLIL